MPLITFAPLLQDDASEYRSPLWLPVFQRLTKRTSEFSSDGVTSDVRIDAQSIDTTDTEPALACIDTS